MTSSHGHAEQDGPGTRAALDGLEGSDEAAQLGARMESLRALQELVRDGGLDTDILLDKRRYRRVRSI